MGPVPPAPFTLSAETRAAEGGFEYLRRRNAQRDEARLLGRLPAPPEPSRGRNGRNPKSGRNPKFGVPPAPILPTPFSLT